MGSIQREIWIDVSRGVGILSVVVAHVLVDTNPGNEITWFLFLFHMPMFFILAGMNQKPLAVPTLLKRRSFQLLLPYVFYLSLFTLPAVARWVIEVLRGQSQHPVDWASVLWGGDQLGGATGVLWFLTCLFFAQFAYAILLNRLGSARNPVMAVAAVAALGLGYLLSSLSISLPLAVNVVPVAFFFLWVGNYLGRRRVPVTSAFAAVLLAVALLLACIGAGYSTEFDMKAMRYGAVAAGILIAVSLSLAIFSFSQALSDTAVARFLAYLGKASLTIMALHQGVRFVFQKVIGIEPVSLIVVAVVVPVLVFAVTRRIPVLAELFTGMPPSSEVTVGKSAALQ